MNLKPRVSSKRCPAFIKPKLPSFVPKTPIIYKVTFDVAKNPSSLGFFAHKMHKNIEPLMELLQKTAPAGHSCLTDEIKKAASRIVEREKEEQKKKFCSDEFYFKPLVTPNGGLKLQLMDFIETEEYTYHQV